ncbi:hypothetical protein LTV02_17280 [Nocardia yamanashiensis]|uniref:hypothetical protein n=1 Tax=Nocardia yamanashiensis TaxID=209247 RepID=UPI001E5DA275|nr:hypothetical protein [Nocardia yamanashiensis]UGT45033.1 hypothetical protein LTV02_17280 [Nocardia yamanashiensis]
MSSNRIRRLAAVALVGAALTAGAGAATAGPIAGTGSAQTAQQPGDKGPFTQESECLSRGNRGIENGEWNDYECVGGYGNWTVVPK